MEDYRDRITEVIELRADQLRDHPLNWRLHPENQKRAAKAMLSRVGRIDVLRAYDSPTHGPNTLVDGHLRKDLNPKQTWRVAKLNITDDEAHEIILTFDTIGAMAEGDKTVLTALMEQVSIADPAIEAMIADLAKDVGLFEDTPLPTPGDQAQEDIPELWGVVVTCKDEHEQAALLERFGEEGLECKAILA